MTTAQTQMVDICALSALSPDRGAAALLPDGTQIGVFVLEDGSVHAVQQRDPYSGTNVLSRGLVGTHDVPGEGDAPATVVATLASPMYKQVWDLDTGAVIDAGGGEPRPIDVYDAEVREGRLLVSTTPRPRAAA